MYVFHEADAELYLFKTESPYTSLANLIRSCLSSQELG